MDVENTRWWKLHNTFPWLLCATAVLGKYSPVVVFLQIPSCSLSFCHVIQLFFLSSACLIPCVQLPQGSFKSSSINKFCRLCVCTGQLSDCVFFSFMWVNMYVHSVSYSDCEHIEKVVGHLYFHLNICWWKCSIANISQGQSWENFMSMK